ncbi:hypothetical protein EOA88_35595 [Mesorhizobium sp. M5C.F.Ca.IN.020.14.1.1]|nr:hypothetical protein EOA88_35595 [Mesorhizobium sp. M5C.F.Ca.IN.020.14.1.1]
MARTISNGPHWLTGITMTPIHFQEDNVVHGQLELHTEEGTITFEITDEVAEGMIKAMHRFRLASKSVVRPAA